MKIALLAPLWKKVPPEKYGGTELVVANLAKGLHLLGHDVTTFACAGSKIDGQQVEVLPDEMYRLLGGFKWDAIQAYEFLSYYELGKRIKEFDIVHNHMGLHPVALAPFLPIPFVTTLHSSLTPDFPYLVDKFKNECFTSISDAQRSLVPELNYVDTVHHGIDTDAFVPNFEQGGYLLFIGTLSYNKGIDIAVRTAINNDLPLIIAGELRESEKEFLDKDVMPYIDGKKIKFIGEVNHQEKATLYAGAKAVLFPSRWNEAFGLVIIEALACGTPVISLNNGAPSEIIKNGLTGFVTSNEEEFSSAIGKVNSIDRKNCRAEAENRFSLIAMAKRYITSYEKLIKENK